MTELTQPENMLTKPDNLNMTDQSKPTTYGTPDLIYIVKTSSYGGWTSEHFKDSVKYIRADLVPAEPTGDKASALEQALKYKTIPCRVSHSFSQDTYRIEVNADGRDSIILALQENTAPDDLVKALGILKPYVPFLRISDEERTFLNAFFESHKEKTQVQE